jgi:membrane protein YdbS with pleckstrin-like domain
MSYVKKNLMDGEQVCYRTHRHWTIFGWPLLIFFAGLLAFTGLRLWAPPEWSPGIVSTASLALASVVAVLVAIPAIIDRVTSEFAVTNKRVIIKIGWIQRRSFETLLTKVEGIEVDQGICARIFDYGTIVITGTGGSKERFERIGSPLVFRRKVQEQVLALQLSGKAQEDAYGTAQKS